MTSIGFSAAATPNGADTKMMSKSVVEGTLPSSVYGQVASTSWRRRPWKLQCPYPTWPWHPIWGLPAIG